METQMKDMTIISVTQDGVDFRVNINQVEDLIRDTDEETDRLLIEAQRGWFIVVSLAPAAILEFNHWRHTIANLFAANAKRKRIAIGAWYPVLEMMGDLITDRNQIVCGSGDTYHYTNTKPKRKPAR